MDKIFTVGLSIVEQKFPDGGSITKLGVNVDKFTEWLNAEKNDAGFVNIDIKRGLKSKTLYAEKNQYVKPDVHITTNSNQSGKPENDEDDDFGDEVPF